MSRHTDAVRKLSVVMPVHNALPHLDHAIESILAQTFSDFEFVILDDASTDGSADRLRYWADRDPRIRLLHADRNLGPVGSSNEVAKAARAAIVARMDADDISHPERLQRQFEILDSHPEVGVVASLCDMIDVSDRKLRDAEMWRLGRRSAFVPFAHGAMMYRRKVFEQVGGYRELCEYWEDQDLIVRMAKVAEIVVIPEALYRVRQSGTSTRVTCEPERLERALDRAYRATDLMEAGKDYSGELNGGPRDDAKIDPRVFIALGSVHLWAGGRPQLLRRMISRARLGFDLRTAAGVIWTSWASASPSSLRAFLILLLRVRNSLASAKGANSAPLRWEPLKRPTPIGGLEQKS